MLRNKIIRFKKIYKFYFDHFLIKWTVCVLNVQNVIKHQKLNFSDKLCDVQKKMLRNKIVRFKKMYKYYFDHFLIGIIVFLINMKMLLSSRQFKFLKNYRNVYVKSSASIVMRMYSLRAIEPQVN